VSGLHTHDVGDGVPQQRIREDRAAAKAVGEKSARNSADKQAGEQRGDKARDTGRTEQAMGGRRQQPAFDETRRDIAGVEQVVEFEEEAEAQQDHEFPDGTRGGQAVEPRGNRAGIQHCCTAAP